MTPVHTTERGSSRRLSLPRRMVCDLMHFARRVPTVPVQKAMSVAALTMLRKQSTPRVGWAALFTKAFAIVSQRVPELRRVHCDWPVPRLYEHPQPVASISVERELDDGERGVFFTHIPGPETLPLPVIEDLLHRAKTAPVRQAFRFYFFFDKLPRVVRRLAYWWLMNCRGSRKCTFMGTYGVSVYSALGVESLHPLSTLTTTLNYGVIETDGSVTVRIIYDHRVLDGATLARALNLLQDVLNSEIKSELESLATVRLADAG